MAVEKYQYIVVPCMQDDMNFCCRLNNKTIPGIMRQTGRCWAYDEMDFVLNHMDFKGGVLIEVGGNIGTTTVYFAKK